MMQIQGRIVTRHARPACVAESLTPDHLRSMTTQVERGCVVTQIEGEHLRSIVASVDDYLMNLAIADEVCVCGSD
jgi:hypothetical protein